MLSSLLVFWLFLSPPAAIGHQHDDVATWIADLGADDWSRREEAARRILEAGPEAVEALRKTLLDPDPEIRARAKELLAILSPPILHLDVIRVGNLTKSSLLGPRDEITGTTIRFHQSNLLQTTVSSRTEERRIQAEIRGTEPPYSVEILFPGINTASISGPPARGVEPGVPWVIFSEERVVMEKAQGRTRTRGELATWVALLSNDLDEASANLAPEERIARAVKATLPQTDDPDLLHLAGVWEQVGPIPVPAPTADSRLHDAAMIARLCRKDQKASAELAKLTSLHLDGAAMVSIERADSLIPPLLEAGIEGSIDLFIRHRGDLSPWRQHLSWLALEKRIQDQEFVRMHCKKLVEAILSPEALPVLRWTNSRLASLWTSLHHLLPTDQWAQVLNGRIDDALAVDIAQSSGRIPLVLGTLAYLSNRSVSLPEGWDDAVIKLLATRHAEIALGILCAQHSHVGISEEIWLKVIKEFGVGLSSTDNTISFRVRTSVTRLVEFDFLTIRARRELMKMLAVTLSEGAPNHRGTAEQLLSKGIGGKPQPRQRTKTSDFYEKRAAYWQQRLEDLPDEELYPNNEDSTWIQLLMADMRIDPHGEVLPMRVQSVVVKTGDRELKIGDEGEDESVLVEISSGNTYRISGSVLLIEDRPVLTRLRPRWRRWAHRFNSARLGPESAEIRSSIGYQTLVLLRTLDEEPDQAQKGWDLSLTWDDIEKSILESLNSEVRSLRLAAIDIVTTLKLTSAMDQLISIWNDDPDEATARALLVLGDPRGKYMLLSILKTLETRVTRDAQKALEQLIFIGDPTAVNQVLSWLEMPLERRNRVLENQLPMALRALETLISNDRNHGIPRERLLKALVQRTDTRNLRSYAIPMLRRLTGVDLGWWNTFSLTDTQERTAAQEEIASLWKTWWARRGSRNENPVKLDPSGDR